MKQLIKKFKALNKGELFGRLRFFLHKKTHFYDRFYSKATKESHDFNLIHIFRNEKKLHETKNPFFFNYCGKTFDIRKVDTPVINQKWYLISESETKDDIRVYWEFARLQNLNLLVSNYLISGDSSIINETEIILSNWFQTNPIDFGLNHISNLEIAIRFITLYRIHYYFQDKLKINLRHILFSYGIHIFYDLHRTNLCVPNNHSLGEAVVLFLASKIFGKKDWEKYAKKTIIKRIGLINENGECLEESSGYHLFVTQMLLILSSTTDVFDKLVLPRIIKSIGVLKAISDKSGFIGKFGDCDDGLFYCFDSLVKSNIIQLGLDFLKAGEKIEPYISSNDFKLDNNATNYIKSIKNSDWRIALIGGYEMHHAHCQCLSVLIWHKDKQIVFDSGNYHYNGSEEKIRLMLASKAYSNSPTLLDYDRSNFVTKFRHVKKIKNVLLNIDGDMLVGKMHFGNKVIVRKVVIEDNKIKIVDSSDGFLGPINFCVLSKKQLIVKENNEVILPRNDVFSQEYGVLTQASYFTTNKTVTNREVTIEI